MRIAVLTWSVRAAGGVETYISDTVAALAGFGHTVSVWYETDEPRSRPLLPFADDVLRLQLLEQPETAAAALGAWTPDVVLLNRVENAALERAVVERYPSVVIAHDYHATCISGTKTMAWPAAVPCTRRFGPGCLAAYLPRRCGGLNPATMVRLYLRSAERLDTARRAARVVTLSEHVREEYVRNGVSGDRVVSAPSGPACEDALFGSGETADRLAAEARPAADVPVQLIVIARLEPLKGVHVAIDALPAVAEALGRPVHLAVLGDGRERARLERRARAVCADSAAVQVSFQGWRLPAERDAALGAADLIIVPSLWPEPFGLVGVEAGRAGVPAVAFDRGGVREWLTDGVNGRLVSPRPRPAVSLSRAVADCLRDPDAFTRMRQAARDASRRHTPHTHAQRLLRVLEQVAQPRTAPLESCA